MLNATTDASILYIFFTLGISQNLGKDEVTRQATRDMYIEARVNTLSRLLETNNTWITETVELSPQSDLEEGWFRIPADNLKIIYPKVYKVASDKVTKGKFIYYLGNPTLEYVPDVEDLSMYPSAVIEKIRAEFAYKYVSTQANYQSKQMAALDNLNKATHKVNRLMSDLKWEKSVKFLKANGGYHG